MCFNFYYREAKSMCKPKDITLIIADFGEAIHLCLNSNATKISFTAANLNLIPMARLYVWDRDSDIIYIKYFEKDLDVNERFVYKYYFK